MISADFIILLKSLEGADYTTWNEVSTPLVFVTEVNHFLLLIKFVAILDDEVECPVPSIPQCFAIHGCRVEGDNLSDNSE